MKKYKVTTHMPVGAEADLLKSWRGRRSSEVMALADLVKLKRLLAKL